jgi:hypothetical protein
MHHKPSLDPRYKNRSRLLATRLDGYTGSWMRSHPEDGATLNQWGCFKKEVWIWEPAEESDAD